MPFADYDDWEDCIKKNQDKSNPEAYCGYIKHKVEDKKDTKDCKETKKKFDIINIINRIKNDYSNRDYNLREVLADVFTRDFIESNPDKIHKFEILDNNFANQIQKGRPRKDAEAWLLSEIQDILSNDS